MKSNKTFLFRMFLYFSFGILAFLLFSASVILPFININDIFPNRENPPEILILSDEKVIRSIHSSLNGSDDAKRLYNILDKGVSIYYLSGPHERMPNQRFEYDVSLGHSRWYAGVSSVKRTIIDGKIYEIWVVDYGGQGRWFNHLRNHRHYYIIEANSIWSEREIIKKYENKSSEEIDNIFKIIQLGIDSGRKQEILSFADAK